LVVVSGWRADNEHGVVLLVTDPTAAITDVGAAVTVAGQDASPPPQPTTEERMDALERQLQGVLRTASWNRSAERPFRAPRAEESGRVEWLLTFGQFASALGCVAAPLYALIILSRAAEVRERVPNAPNPALWVVVGAALGFLYSAAMFVVFTRCKRVPPE